MLGAWGHGTLASASMRAPPTYTLASASMRTPPTYTLASASNRECVPLLLPPTWTAPPALVSLPSESTAAKPGGR